MTRLRVRYEGRVQGVGFRATVGEIARGFQVTGRVCNVSDGSVELIGEGDDAELVRFQAAIRERLERYIRHAYETWDDTTSGWTDFDIGPDKLV